MRRCVTIVLLTGAVLILVACGVRVWQLATTVLSLKGHLEGIQALAVARQAGPDMIIPAREHIIGIRDGLTTLQAELGVWLLFGRHLGWMPGVGAAAEDARRRIDMPRLSARAADWVARFDRYVPLVGTAG